VIQYSRAFLFIISALEYWVARSSRAMTTEYEALHYSAALRRQIELDPNSRD
jgi:hypothetical protein